MSQEIIKELHAEIDRLKAENKVWKDLDAVSNKQIFILQDKLDQAEVNIKELKSQLELRLNDKNCAHVIAFDDYLELKAEIERLSVLVRNSSKTTGEFYLENERLTAENDKLQKHFDNCSADKIVTLNLENERLKAELAKDQTDQKRKDEVGFKGSLVAGLIHQATRIKELEAELEQAKGEIDSVIHSNQLLHADTDRLSRALEQAKGELVHNSKLWLELQLMAESLRFNLSNSLTALELVCVYFDRVSRGDAGSNRPFILEYEKIIAGVASKQIHAGRAALDEVSK